MRSTPRLQATLSDVQRKCGEANFILGDYDNAKKKVVIENADLLRQTDPTRDQGEPGLAA